MRAALVFVVMVAAPVSAQIAPGMTRQQVVDILGRPASERHFGAHDYLLFDAGCSRKCGDDLVILDHDLVVDAVIRSAGHTYTGTETATTLNVNGAQRPATPAITPAAAGDSTHRSGMVFEGPRPPAKPPQYQYIVPKKDSAAAPH
ncbi:MAG TPA: outer membrane protein assembly factor BamE [Gemmatimonadaceae bacterium]|nr:outer membrane protein assembly factor BamE [Gemmatimonadaceae bacterium]